MSAETRIVSPGPSVGSVIAEDGTVLQIPDGWELLPPGDAGLTRRVKAAGPTWTVKERRGRRFFSRGVWAAKETIQHHRRNLDVERSSDAYRKRRQRDSERRDKQQTAYVEDFRGAVLSFLGFVPQHSDLAQRIADAVTAHATPVGSGTVARTKRIPIERRAESAVIAWMRHQTTAYDEMSIPRVKGKRREVRRQLAERSRLVLQRYRNGTQEIDQDCPLRKALGN